MAIKFTNNANAELSSGIGSGDLSLSVKTGQGDRFPAVSDPDYFYLTLVDGSGNREIVKVTARGSGSDSLTIVRAQEGTSARTFSADDVVELRFTAGGIAAIQAETTAVGSALTTHKSSSDHDGRYYTETEIDTNHYTKTNLQTSGQASVHAGNLTSKTGIAHSEITDDQATKHRLINDSGTLTTELFSASKILAIESAINSALSGKAPTVHTHDDRYYTEAEITSFLAGKLGTAHATSSDHDSRYYTESEVSSFLAGKANVSHNHDGVYAGVSHSHVGVMPYSHLGPFNVPAGGTIAVPEAGGMQTLSIQRIMFRKNPYLNVLRVVVLLARASGSNAVYVAYAVYPVYSGGARSFSAIVTSNAYMLGGGGPIWAFIDEVSISGLTEGAYYEIGLIGYSGNSTAGAIYQANAFMH